MLGLSASSPVKKTPESAEPQDSTDPSSSSQESLSTSDASKDAPAPKPDPDAWIQVEKRHRQTSGKAKVMNKRGKIHQLHSFKHHISIFHPVHHLLFFCSSSHFIFSMSSIFCRFLLFRLSFVSSTFRPAACQ